MVKRFLFCILIFSSLQVSAETWKLAAPEIFPQHQLLFENEETQVLAEETSETVTVFKFPQFVESSASEEALRKERANLAGFTGWEKQTRIKPLNIGSAKGWLTKTEWDEDVSYEVELWADKAPFTFVVVATYSSQLRAEQSINDELTSLVSNLQKATRRTASERTEAGVCLFCDKTLFEGPIRAQLKNLSEKVLAAECAKSSKKPMSAGEVVHLAAKGCLKGAASAVTQLIEFAYELLNFTFKIGNNPEYRNKLKVGFGYIVGQILRDPVGFAEKIFRNILGSVQDEIKKVRTCGIEYQVRLTCQILTDMLGGYLVKYLRQLKTAVPSSDAAFKSATKAHALVDDTKKATSAISKPSPSNAAGIDGSPKDIKVVSKAGSVSVSRNLRSHVRSIKKSESVQPKVIDKDSASKPSPEKEKRTYYSKRDQEMHMTLRSLNLQFKNLRDLPSALEEIKRRNDRALEILAAELKEKGISYKIVHPKIEKDSWYADDMLLERKEIAKELEELKSSRLSDDEIRRRILLQNKLAAMDVFDGVPISNFQKSGLKSATLSGDELGAGMERFVDELPYIQILPSEKASTLNKMMKDYSAEIRLVPGQNTFYGHNGSVQGGDIFNFPTDAVFRDNMVKDKTVLHERLHLFYAKALRERRETPYQVSISSDRVPVVHESLHNSHLSLEELETWRRNVVQGKSTYFKNELDDYVLDPSQPNAARRPVQEGTAWEMKAYSMIADASYYNVKKMRQTVESIGAGGIKPDGEIKLVMNGDPNKPPYVLIPIEGNGKFKGQTVKTARVYLTKLNEQNKESVYEILNEYLDLVEAKVLWHRDEVERLKNRKPF